MKLRILATLITLVGLAQICQAQSVTMTFNKINASVNYRIPDHLHSLNPNEGPQNGYTAEPNKSFILSATSVPGFGTPIYRCATKNSKGQTVHFLSNSSNCEGRTFEALMGYAANGPGVMFQVVRVTRYLSISTGDHLVALENTPVPADYRYESTLGYAMQASGF